MRKSFRKILLLSTAAVMAFGALSFAGCDKEFTPLKGDYTSESPAVSNGGFVVEYGNYVYFINGMEAYTANNAYGTPVKGALMRIAKNDLEKRDNKAETVIPSLMVSADYTAGLFIYKDRVYYATPNNVKNMSGEVENDYLDFKSAKLDGSDIQNYFRVEDNATVFRYVESEGAVYLVYHDESTLHSYNTATKTDTTLAENVTSYVLSSSDKTDPYVYYTMEVKTLIDTDNPVTLSYNQVYRVRADVTQSPYPAFSWDEEYLKDHEDKAPYCNLGEIVLDGIGGDLNEATQFTHHAETLSETDKNALPPVGYTYTLLTYANDGLYFTRKGLTSGSGASLYYLAESKLTENWNSIAGNKASELDVVAKPSNTANTTAASIFYIDEAGHHYLYVKDENIIRADVAADGTVTKEQEVCFDASGATLVSIDRTSDSKYHYVWFTRTNGSGYSVERAVFNGNDRDYDVLQYGDTDNSAYRTVKFLNLQHTGSWYPYEVIGDKLFISDAEPVGSSSYGYISYIPLSAGGKFLNNAEVEKLNDKYDAIMDSDASVGYIAKLKDDGKTSLANAITYYFATGETAAFYDNIKAAEEAGKKNTYLYTEDEQTAFKEFSEGKGDAEAFVDENKVSYRTRSYFITKLGQVNEADGKAIDAYWSETNLKHYAEPEKEEGLEAWEWALIGVAIGVFVIGVGVTAYVVVRRKKRTTGDKVEQMRVDITDDKTLDVYSQADKAESEEEKPESEE